MTKRRRKMKVLANLIIISMQFEVMIFHLKTVVINNYRLSKLEVMNKEIASF